MMLLDFGAVHPSARSRVAGCPRERASMCERALHAPERDLGSFCDRPPVVGDEADVDPVYVAAHDIQHSRC